MQITLGKMRKRPNSTKRTLSASTTVNNITLKEATSIYSPTFILHTDPSDYNYVVWGEKYYYIEDKIYVSYGVFQIVCKLDILATYRKIFTDGALDGILAYCSDEGYWDDKMDDMRFRPTYLGDSSNQLFDDLNYLHTNSNIFGLSGIGSPKLWDATFTYNSDANNYLTSGYGDGLYILKTASGSIADIYLLNTTALNGVFASVGSSIWAFFTAADKAILSLRWMPIKIDELRNELPNGSYTLVHAVDIKGTSYEVTGGTIYKLTSNPVYIQFTNNLAYPIKNEGHPYFLENSRWNTMQLITPNSTVMINLDDIYPYSWANRPLAFSTMFDVVSGNVNVKFLSDCKNGYSESIARLVHQTSFNISLDIMDMVTLNSNQDAILTAAQSGMSIANSVVPLPKAASSLIGQASSMANENTLSGSGINMQSAGSMLELFNSTQIGGITLRLKPFRCYELAHYSENDALAAYKSYCSKNGYPSNHTTHHPTFSLSSNMFVQYRDVMLDINYNGYAAGAIEGMRDEEIEQFLSYLKDTGVWLEQ